MKTVRCFPWRRVKNAALVASWTLGVFQLVIIIIVFNTFIFSLIEEKHVQRQNVSAFWFETERAYNLRMELSKALQASTSLKEKLRDHYLKTSGYDEGYFDSLPLIREVPEEFESKIPFCDNQTYNDVREEQISIVMHFFNEPLSLVLRTVYSALRTTPQPFLKEIIVMDDGSTNTEHVGLFSALLMALYPQVRYVKNNVAMGLVPARRAVLTMATGEQVFLVDAHVEFHDNWYMPLLAITQANGNAVAAPVIDLYYQHLSSLHKFDGIKVLFNVFLSWETAYDIQGGPPFWSGALLGGAYMIKRRRLEELDYVGRGMEGYGRENIEIGLKSWMCGGEVWTVPCSRMTHFSALRTPESHPGRPQAPSIFHNAQILAESFIGDKHLLRIARIYWNRNEIADEAAVEFNRNLSRKLGCKDAIGMFRRVMPTMELFTDDETGGYKLTVNGYCTHFIQQKGDNRDGGFVEVSPCESTYDDQLWIYPRYNRNYLDIKVSLIHCLDLGAGTNPVGIYKCHFQKGNQAFVYYPQLQRMKSLYYNLCLDVNNNNQLSLSDCDKPGLAQISFAYNNYSEALIAKGRL